MTCHHHLASCAARCRWCARSLCTWGWIRCWHRRWQQNNQQSVANCARQVGCGRVCPCVVVCFVCVGIPLWCVAFSLMQGHIHAVSAPTVVRSWLSLLCESAARWPPSSRGWMQCAATSSGVYESTPHSRTNELLASQYACAMRIHPLCQQNNVNVKVYVMCCECPCVGWWWRWW